MSSNVIETTAAQYGLTPAEGKARWQEARRIALRRIRGNPSKETMRVFERLLKQAQTANKLMETTIASAIPGLPQPLGGFGPFSDEEKKLLVHRIKSLFPKATESAILRTILGSDQEYISG